MGRPRKPKENEDPVEENTGTNEGKTDKEEDKESDDLIMLATFKDIANLDNMTYQGFKASLKANDEDKFKESELEKKLEEYKAQSAFIT